jgi:hypothetical protein
MSEICEQLHTLLREGKRFDFRDKRGDKRGRFICPIYPSAQNAGAVMPVFHAWHSPGRQNVFFRELKSSKTQGRF